jgi:predicted Abi (CAAX) family protease
MRGPKSCAADAGQSLTRLPHLARDFCGWRMLLLLKCRASLGFRCGLNALDVWSRDLVVQVMEEPQGLIGPGFADGLIGREAT